MSKITMSDVRAIVAAQPSNDKVFEKLARLRWESEDPDDVRLGMIADKLRDRYTALLEETNRLRKKAFEVETQLVTKQLGYVGINSHGELQSLGSRFDVYCALYVVAYEELNRELARRVDEEVNCRYGEAIATLSYSYRAALETLSTGDHTAKQLAAKLGMELPQTTNLIASLVHTHHLAEFIGPRHVRKSTVERWHQQVQLAERLEKEKEVSDAPGSEVKAG